MDDPIPPNIPSSLESARITSLPSSFYYIPNFLTPAEQNALLQKVCHRPPSLTQGTYLPLHLQIPPNRWQHLSHRRLQAHPSTLTATNTLIAAPLPPWLTTSPPVAERFAALGLFAGTPHKAPNHVLVNEYGPGQGIMPHEDGTAYAPVVATVSLGGTVVLDLYAKRESDDADDDDDDGPDGGDASRARRGPTWRLLQEPGSLLVTMGEAYGDLIHGIAAVEVDHGLGPETVANWGLLGDGAGFEGGVSVREMRVSLTYRDVVKVSRVGMNILGRR
jgi:alkylated DNA repair protein alkB family protein 6